MTINMYSLKASEVFDGGPSAKANSEKVALKHLYCGTIQLSIPSLYERNSNENCFS